MPSPKKQPPAKPLQTTSLMWRVVSQAVILTTFITVAFATISFVMSRSVMRSVVEDAGSEQALLIGMQTKDLAMRQGLVGFLFILAAGGLAYLLAKQLTGPLRDLTAKVTGLRPEHWRVGRTVHTGDEVEVLDIMVNELAERLERVYEHLEEEIAIRTAELKKQYALDRTILDGMKQGVIAVDKQGLITGVNRAALSQLEIALDDVLGLEASKVIELCGHGGNALSMEHPVSTCLETRTEVHSPANDHWSLRKRDGTLLPVLLVVTPLIDGKSIFGALVVFQDITEERKVDYMKSEFISLASHQLRTPLSAMRWYVELFEEDKKRLNEEQKGYLKEMDHALKRMVMLLASLLHAAHLEGEGVRPEVRSIDMVGLVREMEQDGLAAVHESGHTCSVDLPKKSVMIVSDPTLLRIVLQNLLNNALKYSAKGSQIKVALSVKQKSIVLTIADKGYGIPADEQNRVFQRFFRAKNIRKMDTDGNGLGLYITHSIVEKLGGTITFKSKENEGTTFTVTLPVKGKK